MAIRVKSGSRFVYAPSTPDKELRAWLKDVARVKNVTKEFWMVKGIQRFLLHARRDPGCPYGVHAHGRKYMFFKNGEGFVKRMVIISFEAWEVLYYRVCLGESTWTRNRHNLEIDWDAITDEEWEEWLAWRNELREAWESTVEEHGVGYAVLHWLARVTGINWLRNMVKYG